MPKVNPDILIWARETAGLSLEEASRKLGISEARGIPPPDRLAALESGEIEPTRSMLVKMEKHYRRPLLVFYMSAPPLREDRGQDFRKLPENYSDTSEANVDALIRGIIARQRLLRAALEDEDEAVKLPFVGSMKLADGVKAVLASIQNTINFDLGEFRKRKTVDDAFSLLRTKVETIGVFVVLVGDLGSHHTEIGLDQFRGFALADDVAPFVVINDRDSKAAWSFTLVHELVHIWLGQTGISNNNPSGGIEKFCNEVAGEILLPKDDLDEFKLDEAQGLADTVTKFADKRNISSTMVAYKLYQNGSIDRDTWLSLRQKYKNLWDEQRESRRKMAREKGGSGGPSHYVTRRHRLGTTLVTLVQRMVQSGALTTTKAGIILGEKGRNVQKLFEA